MLLLNKQLHLLKRDISYLGYVRHVPPVVFSFEKKKHVERVQKHMTMSSYDIKYHPYNNHFLLERTHESGFNGYYIETSTCFSITTYLLDHNIDMFIVSDIIEDKDKNVILMSENSKNVEF